MRKAGKVYEIGCIVLYLSISGTQCCSLLNLPSLTQRFINLEYRISSAEICYKCVGGSSSCTNLVLNSLQTGCSGKSARFEAFIKSASLNSQASTSNNQGSRRLLALSLSRSMSHVVPGIHSVKGYLCDLCGHDCDPEKEELNALDCTFANCDPTCAVYHQECLEKYLRKVNLEK